MITELEGKVLDWAVATALGWTQKILPITQALSWFDDRGRFVHVVANYEPSVDWSQGGPIIDEYKICIDAGDGSFKGDKAWEAHLGHNAPVMAKDEITGPTPLIAAMRAFVASKLEVHIER